MPRIVDHAVAGVGQSSQHEEQITQAVEVLDSVGGNHRFQTAGQCHHPSLRPPTHGAGHVQGGRQRRASRQDETLQRLEFSLVFVDGLLERLDMPHRDSFLGVAGRGELGAKIEELALDAAKQWIELDCRRQRADEAQVTVEFIDRAEGFDAGMVFRDPGAAKKAGFTGVTRLGVDLHPCSGLRAGRSLTDVARASILKGMNRTFNPPCGLAAGIVFMISAGAAAAAPEAGGRSPLERRFFSPPTRLTEGFPKAGEGYFSPDGRQICFQAFPAGYPFYQIYVQPFDPVSPRPTTPRQISSGRGRTTCSWFSPDGSRLLFASSHLDPNLAATEQTARDQAAEDARTGRRRRYQWDFDPQTEIFSAGLSADGTPVLQRLTDTAGYDAECSYSPDGSEVLFVSDRDGDPDIFVMKADGTNVRQLTDEPGYDGGPFFSPDGRWVTYRTDRLEKDLLQIHVMKADGSDDVAITSGAGVRWAPFWHPTRPWLIWTGADHSDPTKRPNYDLWIARYETADGRFRCGSPLRLTDHPGADVLPAFSPDGTLLMWTASRDDDGGGRQATSQLWVATLDLDAIDAALTATSPGGTDASP
jgi:TolB protein